MHQLFSRLDAKPNDSHKQENHSVEFFSRISLETLQSRLLDGLYLLFENAKSLHLTLKRCERAGWQRNPLGGSYIGKFLRCLAQGRVEVADPELDEDRLHPVDRAGPYSDECFTFTIRASAILLGDGRDDGHAAVATLTAQPAKKTTLQHCRINPIRFSSPVFA